jgi:hypothetical protein
VKSWVSLEHDEPWAKKVTNEKYFSHYNYSWAGSENPTTAALGK